VTGLERDGYAIIADVLRQHEIEALCNAFEAATTDGGTEHVRIDAAVPNHAAWLSLAENPVIAEAAALILGGPVQVSTVHGRNPLPGFGQQGLHADWLPRSRGEPFVVATAIVMLDAFTGCNGATRLVPGTHLLTTPVPKSYAQPLAHHPDEILATGNAGSVLIINGHLWHSGTLNRSSGPRRAVQMSMRAASDEPTTTI